MGLHAASSSGWTELARLLLDNHANVDAARCEGRRLSTKLRSTVTSGRPSCCSSATRTRARSQWTERIRRNATSDRLNLPGRTSILRLPHYLKRRREGRNLERLPMPPALELAAQPIRAGDCTAGCAVRVTSQVLPS